MWDRPNDQERITPGISAFSRSATSHRLTFAYRCGTIEPVEETKNERNILVNKFRYHLRSDGLLPTIRRASRYLRLRLRGKKKWEEVAKYATAEEKFQAIYEHNLWGNDESVSGAGSTFRQTVNLREKLPQVFIDYSVKKVFDAPCGDFNWMKHLLPTVDVEYIGGDVVRPLIAANRENFASATVSFVDLDLISDDYPAERPDDLPRLSVSFLLRRHQIGAPAIHRLADSVLTDDDAHQLDRL